MIRKFLLGLTVIGFACAGVALAQQASIKCTPLQKAEFPDGYATVTAMAEVPAGGSPGRHTHPVLKIGYILEGEVDLLVEGQPAQHLKPGDSCQIAAGTVHDALVSGDKALKFIGIYVVDKTRPLASPAP
jgi:quercetin dioxygenase-like cupin family protein